MASRLHAITLFARAGDGVGSLPTIVRFFKEGLLLNVTELGQEWARVDSGASVPIMVQTAGNESYLSSSYMPILTFSVNDMDTTVPRLLSLGGSLDGPIKYHAIGKVKTFWGDRMFSAHASLAFEAAVQEEVSLVLGQGDAFRRLITLLCTRVATLESELTKVFGTSEAGPDWEFDSPSGATGVESSVSAGLDTIGKPSGAKVGSSSTKRDTMKDSLSDPVKASGLGSGSLVGRLGRVEALLARHDTALLKLAALEEKINRLAESQTIASAALGDLGKDVKAVRSSLSGCEGAVRDTEARVTALEESFGALQKEVSSLPKHEERHQQYDHEVSADMSGVPPFAVSGEGMGDGTGRRDRPSSSRMGPPRHPESSSGDLRPSVDALRPASASSNNTSLSPSSYTGGSGGVGGAKQHRSPFHPSIPLTEDKADAVAQDFTDAQRAEVAAIAKSVQPPAPLWALTQAEWLESIDARNHQQLATDNRLADIDAKLAAVMELQSAWQEGEASRLAAAMTKLQFQMQRLPFPPTSLNARALSDLVDSTVKGISADPTSRLTDKLDKLTISSISEFLGSSELATALWTRDGSPSIFPTPEDSTDLLSALKAAIERCRSAWPEIKAWSQSVRPEYYTVPRQQEVFRGLLTPLYTLLSLPWPLSDGQVDNGPVGGPSTHSPRKDKPDFLALRATAQKLLGFVESGLLARAFDGLSGVVNDRLYTKVDKGLLGGAPITSTDDIVSRLGALHQSFDDSLKEHMTNVETKLGVAEQARKQVTLVHASLVNAQEMVKEMRGDLDKNVTRGDLEAALNNALRMVPSASSDAKVAQSVRDEVSRVLHYVDTKADSADIAKLKLALNQGLTQVELMQELILGAQYSVSSPDGRPLATTARCLSCNRAWAGGVSKSSVGVPAGHQLLRGAVVAVSPSLVDVSTTSMASPMSVDGAVTPTDRPRTADVTNNLAKSSTLSFPPLADSMDSVVSSSMPSRPGSAGVVPIQRSKGSASSRSNKSLHGGIIHPKFSSPDSALTASSMSITGPPLRKHGFLSP